MRRALQSMHNSLQFIFRIIRGQGSRKKYSISTFNKKERRVQEEE
jgi:hypothetical protein